MRLTSELLEIASVAAECMPPAPLAWSSYWPTNSSELAGWAQAVGTFLVIPVSVWLAGRTTRTQLDAQRAASIEQLQRQQVEQLNELTAQADQLLFSTRDILRDVSGGNGPDVNRKAIALDRPIAILEGALAGLNALRMQILPENIVPVVYKLRVEVAGLKAACETQRLNAARGIPSFDGDYLRTEAFKLMGTVTNEIEQIRHSVAEAERTLHAIVNFSRN